MVRRYTRDGSLFSGNTASVVGLESRLVKRPAALTGGGPPYDASGSGWITGCPGRPQRGTAWVTA